MIRKFLDTRQKSFSYLSFRAIINSLEKNASFIVLLLICVLSRLLSAIYYFEDSESLGFAEAVYGQTFFSGTESPVIRNPVFCFVTKALYLLLGNFSLTFSLVGGIAVFYIILYVLKMLHIPLLSLEGVLTSVLLFFNPMIWLMSNKYLPDLAGVAILFAALYYLLPETYRKYDVYKGWLLVGVLAGIKPSYLWFLLLPCIYAFLNKKKYIQSLLCLLLGVSLWIIPLLILTGNADVLEKLLSSAGKLRIYSGNPAGRMTSLVQSIWADGLGGYWSDRSPALLINSAGLLSCCIFGFLILLNFDFDRNKVGIVFLSCIVYCIWVYFFEDILHYSYAVLPLVPLLGILLGYGIIYFLVNFNFVYIKVLMLVFVLANMFLTVVLAVQHTYPTAMTQAKEYILSRKNSGEQITIISTSPVNHFFSAQEVDARYISVSEDSLQLRARPLDNRGTVICLSEFPLSLNPDYRALNKVHFTHSPYISRRWKDIYLYEY